MKKVILLFSCLVMLTVLSAPGSALAVIDAWKFNLSVVNGFGGFTTLGNSTNIDHINVSGTATINQTVVGGSALGQPFTETGLLQLVNYNTEGGGPVSNFGLEANNVLFATFTGLTGTLNGDATITFNQTNTQPVQLWLSPDNSFVTPVGDLLLANFDVVPPSGGSNLNFFGGAGQNATIDVTLDMVTLNFAGLFTDSTNNAIDGLNLHLVNVNSLLDPNFNPNPDNTGVVGGNGTSIIHVQNAGQYNISVIPEPATMFLLGSGLFGLAGMGRRKFFKKS